MVCRVGFVDYGLMQIDINISLCFVQLAFSFEKYQNKVADQVRSDE